MIETSSQKDSEVVGVTRDEARIRRTRREKVEELLGYSAFDPCWSHETHVHERLNLGGWN